MTQPLTREPLLCVESRMTRPELHSIAGGWAAVFSDASPARETPN